MSKRIYCNSIVRIIRYWGKEVRKKEDKYGMWKIFFKDNEKNLYLLVINDF